MPPDLRALLTTVRLSHRDLAEMIGVPGPTVYRWVNGTAAPPADVVAWLERCAAIMAQLPPPPRRTD